MLTLYNLYEHGVQGYYLDVYHVTGVKNAILDMPSSFFKSSFIQYDKQLKINNITWNEYSVEGFYLMLSHTICI